jgi:hypothetical protein
MHTDGWRLVELEDGSSSSSDPEDQVLTELLHKSIRNCNAYRVKSRCGGFWSRESPFTGGFRHMPVPQSVP